MESKEREEYESKECAMNPGLDFEPLDNKQVTVPDGTLNY